MKHVIIGTAGHVDHGKTSLIQALTGVNTDRLKEEQERGMTIDIGFAALRLPNGMIAGIVDVPGHERFIKNMLAGATGVDVVLLVVAADEGVMPQTREHLEILRLLDVKAGVVALTKCDIADQEWIDVVEEDIRSNLKDTYLSSAPIVRVSSTTGRGLDALNKALLSAVSRVEARNSLLPARMPIDRVFSRPGFGTVVTGTLVAGTLQVGDPVSIAPLNLVARVRGLQVHNQKVSQAEAGTRVAVNLAGVDAPELGRGAQLAAPSTLTSSKSFDAYFTMSGGKTAALKSGARVRIHVGTAEVVGRVKLLDDRKELNTGDTAFVQFSGEAEFAALCKDRFVMRRFSPLTTAGGGIILDCAPGKHKRGDAQTLANLESLLHGTPLDAVRSLISSSEFGMSRSDLVTAAGAGGDDIDEALKSLLASAEVVPLYKDRFMAALTTQTLVSRAVTILERYHEQFPLRSGVQKEELRSAIARMSDSRTFNALLTIWAGFGTIKVEGGLVRLSGFEVKLTDRQLGLLHRIEECYVSCGIVMPSPKEVSSILQAPLDAVNAMLKVGAERGVFHYVSDGEYYAAKTVESFKNILGEYMQAHESITVAEFRDLTGSNRKSAMQALEYLDSIHFTARSGDNRRLAQPAP